MSLGSWARRAKEAYLGMINAYDLLIIMQIIFSQTLDHLLRNQ